VLRCQHGVKLARLLVQGLFQRFMVFYQEFNTTNWQIIYIDEFIYAVREEGANSGPRWAAHMLALRRMA